MRYDVVVALVFATERTDENRYDVWDIHTPIEADGPKKALLDAIALTKSVEDWRTLGYPDAPFYVGLGRFTAGRGWEKRGKRHWIRADFPSWLAPSMSNRFDRCNPLKKSIFHIISWILVDREAFDLTTERRPELD